MKCKYCKENNAFVSLKTCHACKWTYVARFGVCSILTCQQEVKNSGDSICKLHTHQLINSKKSFSDYLEWMDE